MKTVFCPKTGTVGTSPGHVWDMSRTSATKVVVTVPQFLPLIMDTPPSLDYNAHTSILLATLEAPLSAFIVRLLPVDHSTLLFYANNFIVMDQDGGAYQCRVCDHLIGLIDRIFHPKVPGESFRQEPNSFKKFKR